MEVEKFIEQESFVVVNPNYPVISVEKAWEAVEMERRNVKEEAVRAFTKFVSSYDHESGEMVISDDAKHCIECFKIEMDIED